MRRNPAVWSGISILGALIVCCPLGLGQTAPAAQNVIPLPNDWSHRHVIFSKPATPEQAERVERDARYWQQRYRREVPILAPAAETRDSLSYGSSSGVKVLHSSVDGGQGDWQENLGSGASVGATNYPAKFTFLLSTANCAGAPQPDFVVYNTGLLGSTGQASIVAYDNLYSGCTGTVPTVYWAYNTGGQILTSPVFSVDGKQVAFVQLVVNAANLVLLKWASSTTESVTSPKTLASVSPTSYATCTAPCMTTIPITDSLGTPALTASSAFYDYNSDDTAWVGDSYGLLHKFTPVFTGSPAEVKAGGWPVQVNPTSPNNPLSDPVHDSVSGNVFVGDAGGYLYSINSKTAAVIKSGQLDFGVGIVQGPIVDSTFGLVYVFASSDGTTDCTGGTTACAAVYELTTGFSGGVGSKTVVGASVPFGTLPNPNPMYIGAFDSTYQNSADATGNLYVCGNTGADPTLYRVPIQAGVFGTVATVAALTAAGKTPACSTVTDFANPNTGGGPAERLFFSVQNNGHPTACAAKGCAMNFVDSPWQASTAYAAGQEILVLRTSSNTLYVNVATVAGTSAATQPTWPATAGAFTTNGGVTWMNQGAISITLGSWAATHVYAKNTRIIDSNGNVEIVTVAGTSSGATPAWHTVAGTTITDGSVTWINGGVSPYAALAAAGGTSGFIIDNTVETLPGASQVYFSTLGNQTCTTSGGTGGCAVQASQSALK
jgi:hypothetical protein